MVKSILACIFITLHAVTSSLAVTTDKASPVTNNPVKHSSSSKDNAIVASFTGLTTPKQVASKSKGLEDLLEVSATDHPFENETATNLASFPNVLDEELYYKYNVSNGTTDTSSSGVWHVSEEAIDRLLFYAVRSFIVIVGILMAICLVSLMTSFVGRIRSLGP